MMSPNIDTHVHWVKTAPQEAVYGIWKALPVTWFQQRGSQREEQKHTLHFCHYSVCCLLLSGPTQGDQLSRPPWLLLYSTIFPELFVNNTLDKQTSMNHVHWMSNALSGLEHSYLIPRLSCVGLHLGLGTFIQSSLIVYESLWYRHDIMAASWVSEQLLSEQLKPHTIK